MSIEGLQARIDQFSAEIAAQKAVLKELERSKSAVQRQLNAIRDPVARLPLEISSAVFIQCLPETPTPDTRAVQILLLNVCNTWTNIALFTPALWATIHMDFPDVQILKTWLRRARSHPLSISLHKAFDDDVAAVLGHNAQQLKHLKISGENHEVDLDPLAGSFSQLQTLTIRVLQHEDDTDWRCIDTTPILRILRLAPNLVRCSFHGIFDGNRDYHDATQKLVLPRLLSLQFGEGEITDGRGDILTHLSLPALQTLSVPFTGISSSELLLFLKRSSPPLQKLSVGSDNTKFSELQECLRLVPSLAHLELQCRWGEAYLIEELFLVLADSPSHFLPNLRILKTRYNPLAPLPLPASAYETAYRVLAARHGHLVSVTIMASKSGQSISRPEGNVRDRLRQLAMDGMEIYIGDPDCNFI
ncbi:hypothetical protein B0H19DRAFT_652614 [Mycena capillaripes]|nr:hypothetical protein B0H19DRAFT_652614 [Mycena capillaripes]